MKPYYQHAGITIYHGDCLEVLPTLGSERVDLILADPPYGETSLAWDRIVLDWPDLAMPLLRASGSVWCFASARAMLQMARLGTWERWHLAQDIVWEKQNGSNFHDDRFRRVHEQVYQFYPEGRPWKDIYKHPVTTQDATARSIRRTTRPPHFGPGGNRSSYRSVRGGPRLMHSVIHCRNAHGHALHPTQKPLGILLPLVEYSCPPKGLVLSPFMGSGSELVAATRLGRQAIGIEIDERYCEIAAKRLSRQGTDPSLDG